MAKFLTPLAIRALDEMVWELTDDLIFVDDNGYRWIIPRLFRCDMASVPRLFWIFMPPSSGESDAAAATHDFAVRFRKMLGLSYMDCHNLFLQGLRATAPRVGWFTRLRYRLRRNIAYGAVVAANWACLDKGYGLHSDGRYNAPEVIERVKRLYQDRINPERFCEAR